MKSRLPLPALFALLVACSGNSSGERANGYSEVPKTREDSLLQEVMAGHDVAMAKMGKLIGHRKQMETKADSLEKAKAPAESVKPFQSAAARLQAAENNMNAWMQAFSFDSARNDPAKRISYLEGEKVRVSQVKAEVLGSLAYADSLLSNAR